MRRETILKIKAVITTICILALAEHGPEYVYTFWQITLLFMCVIILSMNVFECAYELHELKEKERSGRPSKRALKN